MVNPTEMITLHIEIPIAKSLVKEASSDISAHKYLIKLIKASAANSLGDVLDDRRFFDNMSDSVRKFTLDEVEMVVDEICCMDEEELGDMSVTEATRIAIEAMDA